MQTERNRRYNTEGKTLDIIFNTSFFYDHSKSDLQRPVVQRYAGDVRTVQRASLAETFS